ncbi:TolC family protein [Antarcticibacterium flavum]|uniref:TolC family protein n=2 Tax=Antarcticibacterium flavum TaxID=2058175 RepID=A0A5B7X6D8_9FLAO|nr:MULTISPECIES: TolC family protein [Antarcticibacterium]MCM4158425.1 transporter [Antarcticibacterium sp. W02-3]QCY70183.1 TolC family protein [Antarcticibacterium flavum]
MQRMFRSLTFLFLFVAGNTYSQTQVLSKEEAIIKTLENNYGIRMSQNMVEIADNSQSILNSGYLPSISGLAGANYNNEDINATLQGGEERVVDGAKTNRYNASVNLNYTLFDGLGRWYNFKQLKEQYNLTKLEARETIENTILQLLTVYFEVARLTENVEVLEETLETSKERITRARYQFEFGQANRLGILNAEVDVNNDSILLLNTRQQLANAKRDLNVILNEQEIPLENFVVDTTVTFITKLQLENYLQEARQNNVSLLQAESAINISDYAIKVARSGYLPTVGLNGSYGWNTANLPATSFVQSSTTLGYGASLSLSWDLFDGGTTITNIRNAKIRQENEELFKQQILLEVNRDIANALGDYENKRIIYEVQEKNVLTNENNFERSQEQFKVGQITSIEFRQAQINLINARTSKNLAKYDAKLAELQVLQLTGQLLNVEF